MVKSRVFVTDSARGRIFNADTRGLVMEKFEDPVHSKSRVWDRGMTSDGSGRAFDRNGGGRHAVSSKNLVHEPVDALKAQFFRSGKKLHIRVNRA